MSSFALFERSHRPEAVSLRENDIVFSILNTLEVPIHLARRKTFPSPGEFFRPEVYDGNMTDGDALDLNLLSGRRLEGNK